VGAEGHLPVRLPIFSQRYGGEIVEVGEYVTGFQPGSVSCWPDAISAITRTMCRRTPEFCREFTVLGNLVMAATVN